MAADSELLFKRLPDNGLGDLIRSFDRCDLDAGSWVAGGCVRKAWFDLPWKDQDVDFFFPSKDGLSRFTESIKQRFSVYNNDTDGSLLTELLTVATRLVKAKPTVELFSTDNADTWSYRGDNAWKVQAIRKEFPSSLSELFDGFDFTVCQFATDGEMMVATKAAVRDCENGVFNLINGRNKKLTIPRIAKYSAYGFSPNDDIVEKMVELLSNGVPMEGWDGY